MKNKEELSKETAELRRRAEEIAQAHADGSSKNPEDLTPEEIQNILDELRVHQVELKLQNEELRRVQDALEISRSRYFDLYDLAPVGYMTLSEEGIILETNLTAANLLGFSREELVDQPLSRFILKEDQDIYYQYKNTLNKTSKQQRCELRFTTQDGTILWISLISSVEVDPDGARYYHMGLNDITERVQAEEALRASEEKYRSLFNQSTEGVYFHDLKGRILDVNEMACAQSGYSKEALLRLTVFDIQPSDNQLNLPKEEIIQMWHEWSPGQRHVIEAEHQRKDGSVYPVEISTGVVRHEGENALLAIVSDITERVQRDAALSESEERLNLAMAVKNEGIWDWDLTTNQADFDDRYYTMAGYQPGEFAKNLEAFKKRVHPEDIDDVMDTAEQYISGQRSEFHVEFRFKHKNGSWIWIEGKGKIFEYTEDGQPKRFIGTHTDITERKEMEKSLSESEEKFRTLVDQAPLALFLHDIDGQIVDTNRMTLERYGYTGDEVLRLNASDIDVNYVKREEKGAFWNKLNTQRQILFEARHKRKDGTIFPVNISLSAIRLKDQKFILALAEDITERVQAEAALVESEEKFRSLFETMSEGVVYQDAEGKITSANPAAERLLGLSLEQMQGKTSLDPRWKALDQDGNELPGEKHAAMIALRTGEKVENYLQGIYIPERDEYVWILVNAVPQFKAGSDAPYQVYATFTDITERKRAEDDLRQLKDRLQDEVAQKTRELQERVENLERFYDATIEREFRMKELRDEIARLKGERG
jgi:PAS domain S-box-containing protein